MVCSLAALATGKPETRKRLSRLFKRVALRILRVGPASVTYCDGPTYLHEGAQDSGWNGDSCPLIRKPGSKLRAPTFRGGFILLAWGRTFAHEEPHMRLFVFSGWDALPSTMASARHPVRRRGSARSFSRPRQRGCSVCDNRCRLPCSVRMRMKRAVPKDGSYLKEGSALPRYSSELALSPALELADDEEDALLDELGSGSGSGSGFGSGPRDTTMVTVVPSCT